MIFKKWDLGLNLPEGKDKTARKQHTRKVMEIQNKISLTVNIPQVLCLEINIILNHNINSRLA